MPKALRLPISNVYAKGDFTVQVSVGSDAVPLQLILDTGSSTLALHCEQYRPDEDQHLQSTTLVQEIRYGIGGWAGPVAITSMQLQGDHYLPLQHNYVVLACEGQPPLAKADGILGLAYNRLNQATDISAYLAAQQPPLTASMPWPFQYQDPSALDDIAAVLQNYPKHNLTPWFTNIKTHGMAANLFSFYCRRSSVHYTDNASELAEDPLNQGWFVVGGGPEQQDLYEGEFQNIRVIHDVYYNVQLTAMQVGNLTPVNYPAGENADGSNGFIDTGCSGILLPQAMYHSLLQQLLAYNPALQPVLQQLPVFKGVEQGLDSKLIDLTQWPTLYFYFVGDNGHNVKLACPPQDYWQINAPQYGLASFKIIPQLAHFAAQTIIGLPLLCNYFTVFDRTVHQTGVIRCAKAKR